MENSINKDAALAVLARMDAFRQRHVSDPHQSNDWAIRMAEAMLAEAAGFKNRNEWTRALDAKASEQSSKQGGSVSFGDKLKSATERAKAQENNVFDPALAMGSPVR